MTTFVPHQALFQRATWRRTAPRATLDAWTPFCLGSRAEVPIRWLDVDDDLVRRAAAIRARGGIGYADAFTAGAASLLDRPVLTGGPELQVAEELGIRVRWLAKRSGRVVRRGGAMSLRSA